MKLLTPEGERELIERLYARDEKAMALFYDSYKQALLCTIWRIVRQQEMAEDILQESMLKFWLSFPSYDSSKGRLFTWVLRISRNLAIDRLREQRRAREATEPLSATSHTLAAPPTFKPEHIGVRDWLSLVSGGDRQLLELLYLKGYTQPEVAELLHLPVGTVKSRSHRLIHLLGRAIR